MKRVVYVVLGLVCVGLAGLGIALPGLPATPFLLLAAACFARSSPRLHRWLLQNRLFAPLLRNWQETRTIPRRAKFVALGMVAVAGVMIAISVTQPVLKASLLLILGFPIYFISRLRVTESLPRAD